MKLIWRAEARQNLQTIVRYIAERNPAAADDLVDRLRSCLERLSDHPSSIARDASRTHVKQWSTQTTYWFIAWPRMLSR